MKYLVSCVAFFLLVSTSIAQPPPNPPSGDGPEDGETYSITKDVNGDGVDEMHSQTYYDDDVDSYLDEIEDIEDEYSPANMATLETDLDNAFDAWLAILNDPDPAVSATEQAYYNANVIPAADAYNTAVAQLIRKEWMLWMTSGDFENPFS